MKKPEETELNHGTIERIRSFASRSSLSMEEALNQILSFGLERLEEITESDLRPHALLSPLSPMQKSVIGMLRQGKAVKEIAAEMGLAEPTVRTHIARAREKLDCSDLLALRIPGPSFLYRET